jgi:hypothetical protein
MHESVLIIACRNGLISIPKTKISEDFIFNALQEPEDFKIKPTAKIVWLGGKPFIEEFTKSKKEILGNDEFNFPQKGEFQHSTNNRRKMVG